MEALQALSSISALGASSSTPSNGSWLRLQRLLSDALVGDSRISSAAGQALLVCGRPLSIARWRYSHPTPRSLA